MIKLLEIIRVNRPVPNNLKQLEQIQSQIKSSNDLKERQELAIKAAELVLPIWNHYYPNDKRPQVAIESAKLYLANPTEENKVKLKDVTNVATAADAYDVAAYAAYDAAIDAASAVYAIVSAGNATAYAASANYYAYYATADAADYAIRATKIHFKIK